MEESWVFPLGISGTPIRKQRLRRMRPIRPIAELNHGRRIVDIAFTPTNQDIIASVSDYDIKLWNRNNTDSPTNTLSDDEEMLVSVEFLHNGKFLLCKGLHGKMILCDTYSWERITLPEEEEKVQWDAAISPSVENLANRSFAIFSFMEHARHK